MRRQRKLRMAPLMLVFGLSVIANGQQHEGWQIKPESTQGNVLMTMIDSVAVVTHEIVMEVDSRGLRKSLLLEFPSGFEKKGTAGELRYYWSERKGGIAWRQYMFANDRLQILRPVPPEGVPVEWYGRTVACVTIDGGHHIGRLRGTDGVKTWFALEIEGAVEPVKFRVDAVKELHALK